MNFIKQVFVVCCFVSLGVVGASAAWARQTSAGDCDRVLHVGNYSIWLHSEKRTTPSLSVKYNNNGKNI